MSSDLPTVSGVRRSRATRSWPALPVVAALVILGVVWASAASGSRSADTGHGTPAHDTGVASQANPRAEPVSTKATHASWNPHVHCKAHITTLRILLGKARNAKGGATYRGGGFKPGVPDKRSFHPPCRVHGHPTFVQLNGVQVGSCKKINEDGDWTCNLTDPTTPPRRPVDMKSIHIETDKKFRNHTGWSIPPGATDIRVRDSCTGTPGTRRRHGITSAGGSSTRSRRGARLVADRASADDVPPGWGSDCSVTAFSRRWHGR